MAYEQWQQTPQGLGQMYNADVANGGGTIASTPGMMQLLGQQQYADQLTSADQQRQLSQNYNMDPLRVQQQQLENQTTAARIPGIQAQGRQQTVKAGIDEATMQSAIQDAQGKYTSAQLQRHADDIGNIGTTLIQHAATMAANPMAAAQRTHALFQQLGISDMLPQDFDQKGTLDQIQSIHDLGANFQDASAKARQQLMRYQMQGDSARDVAKIRSQGQVDAAQKRLEASNYGWDKRQQIANDHTSLAQAAQLQQSLAQKALDDGDTENATKFMARANEFYARAYQLSQASAQTNTAPRIDLGKTTNDAVQQRAPQPVPAPTANTSGVVPGARPQAAPPPAPAASAGVAQPRSAIPAGRVGIRNVRTGETFHIPAAQLQDALQQGYELVDSNGVR